MNNSLSAIERLSERNQDSRVGLALTGLSVALVAMMAVNEFRRMFRSETRCFDRDESGRHRR